MTSPMTKKRPAALVALFATLLLTIALLACGGGDGDEDATESPAASPATAAATATPAEATPQPPSEATPQPTPEPASEASEPPPAPSEEGPRQIGDVEGVVFQVGDGSEATFTVTEQLQSLSLPNDAVIRTTALSGHVSLDGGSSAIDIDLHQMSSDSSFRDRYIRQRMFPDTPTGTFTVQGLNDLPAGFTDGDTVTASIDGQLTIGSVTTPLTFEVEARDDGEVVYIHGTTSFTWDQLQLSKPIAGPVVSLEDEVHVEVLLAARPSGDSMVMEPTAMPEPVPADTPQPAAPVTSPGPSMPSLSVLIVPPLDGNAQFFLDQLPSDEAICVSAAVPPDQLAMLLGPAGPSGPEGEALILCLSDRTVVRIMLGGMFAAVGQLSPETAACLNTQLDNESVVASVAEGFRAQLTGGSDSPVAMFAMIPFMQCLNADEAATAGLGDPDQIACFIETLGPEGLAALSETPDDPAMMGTLFQAAIACGMTGGP